MVRHRMLTTLALAMIAWSCQDQLVDTDPGLGSLSANTGFDQGALTSIAQQVGDFNARLAAAGSDLRLDYPWMFVVGGGTDPYARLRTGPRWTQHSVEYILDESDYTTDISAASVEASLVSAYNRWNSVPNGLLTATRGTDDGTNFDVTDGSYDGSGNCVFLFDVTSPNLDLTTGLIYPQSDIVVGGWVNPNYFRQCLGSSSIIGVTWSFYGSDGNGDQYADLLYVEQFFNPAFTWVTSGSQFLDPTMGVDLETIATHEDGHAHGLGHFGGPLEKQPFTLKPNGRVYNPEAVMNPFYLYGEKRELHPTDVSGFLTLYAR